MKWDGHGRSVSSRGFGKTLNRGPSAGQAEEEGSRQGPQSSTFPARGVFRGQQVTIKSSRRGDRSRAGGGGRAWLRRPLWTLFLGHLLVLSFSFSFKYLVFL